MSIARSANLLGALVLGLGDEIRTASEREASEGGGAPAAVVLIGHVEGITIEQLRHALGLSHPGAVRLIDRLETNALVRRRSSREDGRAVALVLTSKGQRQRARILAERFDALHVAVTALSAAEREQLERLTSKLLAHMLKDVAHACAICRLCDEQACHPCPIDQALELRQSESGTHYALPDR